MPLDFNELRQLLLTIAQTDITELTLKNNEFELTVHQAVNGTQQLQPASPIAASVLGSEANSISTTNHLGSTQLEATTKRGSDTNVSIAAQFSTTSPPTEAKLVEVPSPMVGTFYRSPAPGEAPFVEVGDRVKVGQTVCIIEAMKLMNEIEAEVSGQIVDIVVNNGEPVEYGQPLMRIKLD